MSITDEMRHEVASYPFRDNRDFALFEEIADRIDIAHMHAICYVDDRDPETMAENGWVRLPKDADGEVINVGDVVDVMPTDKFTGHRNVVVTSVIFRHSAALVTVDTADRPFTFMPNRIRHHHEPTVVDVLEEYRVRYYDLVTDMECKNITNDEYAQGIKSLNTEYAAKLRLADDEKEQ